MPKKSEECKYLRNFKTETEMETQKKIVARSRASFESGRKSPERQKALKLAEQAASSKEQENAINCKKQQAEETSEQNRVRTLANKAEKMRRIRAERVALETPEERQSRLSQRNLAQRLYRKRLSMQSPEQAVEPCAKKAEKKGIARIMISTEQPTGEPLLDWEEVKKKWSNRKYRNSLKRQARETPDETATRLAKLAKYSRERRHKMIASETPEEKKARCLKKLEETRRKREEQRAKETPEQAIERRAKWAEKVRKHRARIKETPEERKARCLKRAEETRRKRKEQRAKETPEQAAERRAKLAEQTRRQKEKRQGCEKYKTNQQKKLRSEHGVRVSDTDRLLKDDIDFDLNASCTYSSFEPSEGSFSIITTTTDRGHTIAPTDQLLSVHQPLNEEIVVKNEAFQDSWSCFDASESTILTQNIFQDNGWTHKVAAKERATRSPTPLIETPVVQAIIVKEEVDLGINA